MGPIHQDEPTTRYIFQKSHFSREKKIVKVGAFIPAQNRKTSIFRITGLKEKEIWDLGKSEVEPKRNQSLKARGDIIVKEIHSLNLKVVPETSQHERHADIINWPNDKAEIQLLAQELALKAQLKIID